MSVLLEKSCLLFIMVLVTICSSNCELEIFITPTPSSLCTQSPCLTLREYLQHDFTSFTTLNFLDGRHILDETFSMSNLENISLIAPPNSDVSINCRESFRFIFTNISGLVIKNISFTSRGMSQFANYRAVISLWNVEQGELSHVSISNSMFGALLIQNSGIVLKSLLITDNQLYANEVTSFGIVTIENSTIALRRSLVFSRNNALPEDVVDLNCGADLSPYTSSNYSKVVLLVDNSVFFADGTLTAVDNVSPLGILFFANSRFNMRGDWEFLDNSVCINGAISFINSVAALTGQAVFRKNYGSYFYYPGLSSTSGLSLLVSTFEIVGDISFANNLADVSSIEMFSSDITITGSLLNVNNFGDRIYSGIILRSSSTLTINGSSVFRDNYGYDSLIRLELSTMTTNIHTAFINNTGASPCVARSNSFFIFNDNTTYENNSGILFSVDSTISYFGNSTFIRNNAGDLYIGGGITLLGSPLTLSGNFLFEGNKLRNVDGGAIFAQSSSVTLQGTGNFINNAARLGGAIYLQNMPRLRIQQGTTLTFEHNSAEKGAAMYVSGMLNSIFYDGDIGYENSLRFIDGITQDTFTFKNNTATDSGSVLYIAIFEEFNLLNVTVNKNSLDILTSRLINNSRPLIDSNLFQLCFCEDGRPVCGVNNVTRNVSRGERLSVSVAGVTVFESNKLRSVRSYFRVLDLTQTGTKSLDGDVQHFSNSCSDLEYRVFTSEEREEIVIAADETCDGMTNTFHCLLLNVMLNECPEGFTLVVDSCICDERIQVHTNSCNVDTGAVTKHDDNVWFGVHRDQSNQEYLGLILYTNCPFDYCIPPPIAVMFSDPNTQCDNNRSGILCGACKGNLSLVLGSSKCTECFDNSFIALLIPIALLGVLLVGFLFLIQLTVASGTINGLIFYANIVSSNEAVFQLQEVRIITVFIDWLNLDFGIQTCFYDGLNQLAYTGWQFAFPLYLWILVAVVIIVCHFSIRASKFFANSDPVAVLATIILLSYNKLLQNIITIFSPANLVYPPNSTDVTSTVWLYDGNVDFAQGSHAILIAVAFIVLALLFLPYTFILLLTQFLQKSKHISTIFNRLSLTPFINTYQAPYKSASRCWIGLCLLLRCILLLVFASSENESVNLLAIITTSIVMVSIIGVAGGVYRNRWLDALEISFRNIFSCYISRETCRRKPDCCCIHFNQYCFCDFSWNFCCSCQQSSQQDTRIQQKS